MKSDNKGTMKNCLVENKDNSYIITENRMLDDNGFLFNLSDEENELIENISQLNNAVYLQYNASFALGIVTGDNKKYITDTVRLGTNVTKNHKIRVNNQIPVNKPQTNKKAPVQSGADASIPNNIVPYSATKCQVNNNTGGLNNG